MPIAISDDGARRKPTREIGLVESDRFEFCEFVNFEGNSSFSFFQRAAWGVLAPEVGGA